MPRPNRLHLRAALALRNQDNPNEKQDSLRAPEHLLEKNVGDAAREVDIATIGEFYYVEVPTDFTRRFSQSSGPATPLTDATSEDVDSETTAHHLTGHQIPRRGRKVLEKCVLRDYGVLQFLSFGSEVRLGAATIVPDHNARLFRIAEAHDARSGPGSTLLLEAKTEIEFRQWYTAFQEIQDLRSSDVFTACRNSRIAVGASATFFRGKANKDGKSVVLKIIERRKAPGPALVETVVGRRLMTVKPQQHPDSLGRYLQVYHTPNETQVIMEYIPGPRLVDWLEDYGPMNDSDAHKVFVQVLMAIKYVHSLDIFHGAVTARNVLLCDTRPGGPVGRVKLIGFSTASLRTSRKHPMVLHPHLDLDDYKIYLNHDGLEYIAPEIWKGEQPCFLTDYWGLGCLLYRMLIGPLPFAMDGGDPWNGVKEPYEHAQGELYRYAHVERVDLQQEILFPKDNEHVSRLSSNARSILYQLLRPNRNRRLGPRSIARHPWVEMPRSPALPSRSGKFWS